MAEKTLDTGAHARGIDLFDESLDAERGYVSIEAGGRQVDHEHRVEYDHDPPVEVDARFFGTKTEISMDFEFGGKGRALLQLPNEEMREFIKTLAPEVGLRVADVDEPEFVEHQLTCACCGDPIRERGAIYDAEDDDQETPFCSSRCWARGCIDGE